MVVFKPVSGCQRAERALGYNVAKRLKHSVDKGFNKMGFVCDSNLKEKIALRGLCCNVILPSNT